ncbi:Nn.00g093960.m01.CDS01 [Neocucurbitaria sp. VM-36]
MSRWRQKGFVLDSDEEEGESLESQGLGRDAGLNGRVERVDDGAGQEGRLEDVANGTQHEKQIHGYKDEETELSPRQQDGGTISTPSTKRTSPKRPTPSPFTPVSFLDTRRGPTESPDPLQSSPTPKTQRSRPPPSSQQLRSSLFQRSSPLLNSKRNDSIALSSQILGSSTLPPGLPIADNATKIAKASSILGEFGIVPLSDDSGDEPLSDPPSDLESPPSTFFTPHRRTAVQVVIPSSKVLQKQTVEWNLSREFRQRKPIQLYPYALESELYRREVQSRGLKPVPRDKSPQRQPRHDAETQEREFDPNQSPLSSPPEREIPVSTPVIQRPRKDAQKGGSAARPASGLARRLVSTQLHLPNAAKRRKLNLPLTQVSTLPTNIFDDDGPRRDIWSIAPDSPPYSSSPPLNGHGSARRPERPHVTTPAPNLPTPSTSSVVQDDPQLLPESDSETVLRSVQRSGSGLRRPMRRVPSDSSSSASNSSSELEQSDKELRKVGRKIKGVLPASWLRFDRKAQERRKVQERNQERMRLNAAHSPQTAEPQRGIAQRVTQRTAQSQKASPSSGAPARDVLIISDDSGDEPEEPTSLPVQENQASLEDGFAVAAVLDSRYADGDLSDMENDRLHLPTLGGTGSKRKKQTKVIDAFGVSKRLKLSNGVTRGVGNVRSSSGRRKHNRSRNVRGTPPPALSVVDLDIPLSSRSNNVPQFLRVARRQALRRPDLARQSPNGKQIRLHNARDTKDANLTLQQWRQGTLKPKAIPALQRPNAQRTPLAGKDDNQQRTRRPSLTRESPSKELFGRLATGSEGSHPRRRMNISFSQMFQRSSPQKTGSLQQRDKSRIPSTAPGYAATRSVLPSFRTAQLEGDEKEFGYGHRKIAFQKGLHRVDQQFGIPLLHDQSHTNPVLARFLAADDAALPPLPPANDVGEHLVESPTKRLQPTKRRLKRKKQAHRVDVDTREYRQPSEPAVEEILKIMAPQNTGAESEQDIPVLQGLGPYGTRYPITFDIHSLVSETYFHSSTFIGSDEFQRALCTSTSVGRDLDDPSGYCTITYDEQSIRCGPWNDETFSGIQKLLQAIWAPSVDQAAHQAMAPSLREEVLVHTASLIRSLVGYISTNLSFLDSIDRTDFVSKAFQLVQFIFDSIITQNSTTAEERSSLKVPQTSIRAMSYLLVLSVQIYRIAQHQNVEWGHRSELVGRIKSTSRMIITDLVRYGAAELSDFLEKNKRYAVRVNGVQDSDVFAESIVICMHVLDDIALPGSGFWDIVSQELASPVAKATHIQIFESTWATIFTFLPFIEVDITGLPNKDRRSSFQGDNWTWTRDLLKRLFQLYPSTYRKHSASLNEYVRANLARCHRLISHWHWKRPEQMLNAIFDYFGKNGLRPLRREIGTSPVHFLENPVGEQSLILESSENSFHVALKILALGLLGMKDAYLEKKIRSFVFRTIPNHGRTYPKDQPLDEESLAALRNHHDLLSTLYWAAPPSCRPKLDHIQHLVNHENSHREACRLNVRAWANLTTFQLSTEEPSASATPFALWHKDIMLQTLRQYQLAKSEADEFLKSGALDGTTDVSTVMIRQTMERNQEKVIATLRDCIAGMRKAIQYAKDQTLLAKFLVDSDIVHLLELPHLEDRRLVSVIRDTLVLLREYTACQKLLSSKEGSQQTSEESQDYGEFPDIDGLEDIDHQQSEGATKPLEHDFIQAPLWHLLSNAFGAETSPDENLLMNCVDTWVCIAEGQVTSNLRSWSYYIDSFSQVSWQQLRHTEQTRKFRPYFMAALIECDPTAYEEHRHDFISALVLSLVDRESMLRFQNRLLHAIMQTDRNHPLLKNLPFFRSQQNGEWDITADTVRSRRLALISSILSNMRDDVQTTLPAEQGRATEVKRLYAAMLKDFMTAMKNNYQQLRQGTMVTGTYVEFVQKIVQFLKQYTSDICPVLPFFTDSVAFPLPAADPTYVVGRLCGYAPKSTDTGTAKQLSVFIQTVAQQAAADNQQSYLVNQLTTALCSTEGPPADRLALQSVLMKGIFPAYLEEAFSSSTAFIIAKPILQALPSIFETMIFDLRINQPVSLSSIIESMLAITHAFIRGTERLKDNPSSFQRPHVLSGLRLMLEASASQLPLLDYIWNRTMASTFASKPPLVAFWEKFTVFIAEMLHEMVPHSIPCYEGDSHAPPSDKKHDELLAFSRKGLEEGMRTNWSESTGTVFFGLGHVRREVVFDVGSVEEERATLVAVIEKFHTALRTIYNGEQYRREETAGFGGDLVV